MKITEALIVKFLNDQCTGEEADAISQYLQQHPDLLETFLPESEWDALGTTKGSETQKRKRSSILIVCCIAALLLLILLLMKLCSRPQKEALFNMLSSG